MENEKVIEFYDPFYSKNENIAINERVYSLYKRMLKAGLCTTSSVIELGCGGGGLTFLISKIVKSGSIYAVDISPAAIAIAKKNCRKKNIKFSVGDILHFTPDDIKKADFITLFDVLEHVPIENHDSLIKHISLFMHAESLLLVNIPNPRHIEYDRIHQPFLLQIIDQPVPLDHIISLLVKHGLSLQLMEIYGVWNESDYQYFVIKKDAPFYPIPLKHDLGIWQRIKRKMERIFVKLFLKYPL